MSKATSPFERTLVIGASVSAALTDRNPTKLFLKENGWLAGSRTHAFGGRPGAHVLSQLKKTQLDDVTAVIGVDLMFWDSVMGLGNPTEARAFLRGFCKEVGKRRLPLILGRIPGFHMLQIHREELNEAIEKEARNYELARVIELDRLFEQVMADEGIHIDGKHHRMSDLIPDGLHPGPVAAQYIAHSIAPLAASLEAAVSMHRQQATGSV